METTSAHRYLTLDWRDIRVNVFPDIVQIHNLARKLFVPRATVLGVSPHIFRDVFRRLISVLVWHKRRGRRPNCEAERLVYLARALDKFRAGRVSTDTLVQLARELRKERHDERGGLGRNRGREFRELFAAGIELVTNLFEERRQPFRRP